jgi:hypothetical protein
VTEYGVTHIHPLALLATLTAGVFLLVARRSQAALAIALVACLIPVAQRVVVASLDFNMIRLLILFGWLRLFARGELRALRLNEMDFAFLAWVFTASTMYVIREASAGALVYRLGALFDSVGVYFLFRVLLHRPGETVQAVRYLAICAAIVMVPMTLEFATGRNLFSIFGGVPAMTWVREGRLRCQGAFAHPILAGTFAATLVPVFVSMYRAFPKQRRISAIGAISGVVIVVLSSSSGPLISLVAGLGAVALWRFRAYTRLMRWGLVGVLTVLHFAREKPVWHLIARVSDLMGGEGYHRFSLIDAFVNRWREWYLVGTPSTAHWGHVLWDTTNQYVDEGVSGGMLTLIAFVIALAVAFRGMGRAARAGAKVRRPARAQGLWCWGLGCGLFAHATAFISVSYWGQMQVLLYLFLALLAAEYSFAVAARNARPPHPVAPEAPLARVPTPV